MTTTALATSTLTSPGAAISARQAIEEEQWRVTGPIIDRFLREVLALAFDALEAPVLLAAARQRDPFAYSNIRARWTAAIAELATYGRYDLDAVAETLADADIPLQLHDDVRDVIIKAKENRESVAKTRAALRGLILPPEPTSPKDKASYRARVKMLARTAATRTFNRRQYRALAQAGAATKTWVSRHDDKVRMTHAMTDGETMPLNMDFIVGGYALAYPGDPRGPAHEIVNCRCVMITRDVDLPKPMQTGIDVFGGQAVQMTDEVDDGIVEQLGKIPPDLIGPEIEAGRILMSPSTNGPLQSILRDPSTVHVPHQPTVWMPDGFDPMEVQIRKMLGETMPWGDVNEIYSDTQEGMIHAIDALIDRTHTTRPSVAYRGFTAWQNLSVGDEFVDRGYTSVSPDFDIAKEFMRMRSGQLPGTSTLIKAETYEGEPMIAVIQIPQNSAIALGDPTVKEFILPRDSRFRVKALEPPYVLLEKIG